jgi:flagellar hook-length control protein FliK
MNVAKKTVKEPEVQTMGGELTDEPKAKKTTKKAAPKKAVKKTAKKTTKTAAKTKTKAEILSKPTKVVRKSVVKNEEHSEFEETDAADIADEVEQDGLDDIGEEETDDSIEY